MRPAFAALYGGSVCEPICPATDERKSIVPFFRSASLGANACATAAAPTRLTRKTRSQSATSSFQKGKPNLPEPTPTANAT
jgi:hypothetical protein